MSSFATSILLAISGMLGVPALPEQEMSDWGGPKKWAIANGSPHFSATSTEIPRQCAENPNLSVHFPAVIQGAQEFYIDGKLVGRFGDPTFQSVESFYGKPQVPCRTFSNGHELRWEVTSYTQYFARISSMPKVSAPSDTFNFLAVGVHALVGGMLLVLGAFACIVSWKKVSGRMLASFALATFALPFYFICSTAQFFGMKGSMLELHRLADVSLWIGASGIFWFLHEQMLVHKRLLWAFISTTTVSIVMILLAPNGDVAQLGTSLPFLVVPLIFVNAFHNIWKFYQSGEKLSHTLVKLFEISFFVIASMNDILFILGLHNGPPIFSLGMLGILFFAAVSLEQTVRQTYDERDYLRLNLEKEVAAKTESLAKALDELKSAQGEIVASAKLASLGTLSAGIAHEINNSLNYVRGSLAPLSNFLKKETITAEDRSKAQRLLGVMQDGLQLTNQIIINLKTYSSANGTTIRDELRPTVENVLSMLHPKIKNKVTVVLDIPENFTVEFDKVCVTQVLSNLIDNACDAMATNEGERKINISACMVATNETRWVLSVSDNGPGIPEHVRAQIFDPFFTTKPVGQGTGLGLYIVNSEVSKRGGKVEVVSKPGVGTTMILHFPAQPQREAA